MKTIIANVDYISGQLRSGHFELNISNEEYEEFKSRSKEEQLSYIEDNGDLLIDDFSIDDYGDLEIINEIR